MKLYKLTDANGCTRNETQWGENITHTASGAGELCGPGWLHAYEDPLLAVLLNPIYGNVQEPILWGAEGVVEKTDHGLQVGCTKLTTLRQIEIPEVTTEQRVKFGILCAKQVYSGPDWLAWADAWLDGSDRSSESAVATYSAAWAWEWAAYSAAWAWAWAFAAAANAEAEAAREAAREAAWAAREAAWAAAREADIKTPLPLAELAREAMLDTGRAA